MIHGRANRLTEKLPMRVARCEMSVRMTGDGGAARRVREICTGFPHRYRSAVARNVWLT